MTNGSGLAKLLCAVRTGSQLLKAKPATKNIHCKFIQLIYTTKSNESKYAVTFHIGWKFGREGFELGENRSELDVRTVQQNRRYRLRSTCVRNNLENKNYVKTEKDNDCL